MKITSIETIPIRLPTRRVHQWASLTTPIGVYVIIRLHTDEAVVGLGEAPVLKDWGGDHGKYYGETPQTTAHIINDILAPALTGQDPRRIEAVHALMDKSVKGYPYCKAAIDAALYDVVGKAMNVPVYQLLGGCFRDRVPIAHSLGLMEIENAVEEALKAKGEGVKTIKLKGGVDPKRDVELIRQMRKASRLWPKRQDSNATSTAPWRPGSATRPIFTWRHRRESSPSAASCRFLLRKAKAKKASPGFITRMTSLPKPSILPRVIFSSLPSLAWASSWMRTNSNTT